MNDLIFHVLYSLLMVVWLPMLHIYLSIWVFFFNNNVFLGGMQATVKFQIDNLMGKGAPGINPGDVILCNFLKFI